MPPLATRFATLPVLSTALFLAVLVASCFPAVVSGDDGQPEVGWTLGQWTTWRNGQIAHILTPIFESRGERLIDRDEVIARCSQSYALLQPVLAHDSQYFNEDPARFRAMEHFLRFIAAQSLMATIGSDGSPTHALGYTVTDRAYWTDASAYAQFPPLLQSQKFLREMAGPAGYSQALSDIEELNATLPDEQKWIVLPYRAQFIKSVDKTTYGRLLIVTPNVSDGKGGLIDRWIQFAIATPEMPPAVIIKSVSIVAVHRAAGGSSRANSYLVDFVRQADPATGEVALTPTMSLAADPSQNCYDCHKSGVIPIKPASTFAFDAQGNMVDTPPDRAAIDDTINKRIATYGRLDLGPMDMEGYGPGLGTPPDGLTDRRIRALAPDTALSPIALVHLRNAADCATCHDRTGPINYLQAVRTTYDVKLFQSGHGMVQSYIENGWMPPGNTLTTTERHALWAITSKQYFDPANGTGRLVDWLRGG